MKGEDQRRAKEEAKRGATEEKARRASEELKRKEEELGALKEAEEAEAEEVLEVGRQPRRHCEAAEDGRNTRKKKGGLRQRYLPRKLLKRLVWLLRRKQAAQANNTLHGEVLQIANDREARLRTVSPDCAGQEASEAKLHKNEVRISKEREHPGDYARARDDVRSAVEDVDQKCRKRLPESRKMQLSRGSAL